MFNWFKKEEVIKPTPKEAAAKLTAEEKQEMVAMIGKGRHNMLITDDIEVICNNLYVDTVKVYGEQYHSIQECLIHPLLREEERYDLLTAEEELKIVRNEQARARIPYHRMNTVFDGELYLYEEGEIALITEERKKRGLPPRALAKIEEINQQMAITEIAIGEQDVFAEDARYVFNLLEPEQVESFSLLVTSNPLYEEEIKELHLMISRLQKHSQLIQQGRIKRVNNRIIIAPPTPDQIKNREGVQ